MKLFVAAMGASNYIYAEACPSESLSDWIGVHASLFRYLGGVPKFVVCDNLKAAVTNPDRYDPGINRTYAEMAGHYGTAMIAPEDESVPDIAIENWRIDSRDLHSQSGDRRKGITRPCCRSTEIQISRRKLGQAEAKLHAGLRSGKLIEEFLIS
jgi:hypothetical protein